MTTATSTDKWSYAIKSTLDKYEEVVFQDGYHDLCLGDQKPEATLHLTNKPFIYKFSSV